MRFAEPLWLAGGLAAIVVLLWTWRRYDARQRAALARFASPHLLAQLTASVPAASRNWKRGLFLAAVGCLCLALARPEAGFRWEKITRRGIEVMFAVDTSRSMLTPDVKPNRLTRAKLAVDDLVRHLNGDGVGLIAFAGDAFLQCPITIDYDAFHESLSALDTGIIPRGGTDIGSAIREARAALRNRAATDKILVLLTDGEDLEGSELTAAKAAAKAGLKIYTIGVGTPGGDLIPIPASLGGGFVQDAAGQYVKSHLDEAGLKAIAEATGGLYAPLGAQGQGLDRIYEQALAPLAKHDLASRREKVYMECFQWPLAASLVLLLSSMLIGARRVARRSEVTVEELERTPLVTRKAAIVAGALLFLPFGPAKASPATAEKQYQSGNYAAAECEYAAAAQRDPKQPDLEFNAGTAAYKAGQFPRAAEAFQKSLAAEPSADPKRLATQEDAYYDLGNTLYRAGQKTERNQPEQTIKKWEQAIKKYDAALQLRAHDADAKYNRDLVKRKLDELKKKQEQQQKQQPQQNQKDKKQDQKDKGQQNQSGKNSDQKNQQNKGQQSGANSTPNQPKDQQQAKSGSEPDKQNQTDRAPQQPKPARGQAQTPKQSPGGADQHEEEAAREADARRQPGQMTKDEARALLDSLKDELQRLPAALIARNSTNNRQTDQPIKDW